MGCGIKEFGNCHVAGWGAPPERFAQRVRIDSRNLGSVPERAVARSQKCLDEFRMGVIAHRFFRTDPGA